jgi:hypothetical protein
VMSGSTSASLFTCDAVVFFGIKKLAIFIGTSAGMACTGLDLQLALRLYRRDLGRV